jgi:hypothetical protein
MGPVTEIVYTPAALTESKSRAYTFGNVPQAPRLAPTAPEETVLPPEFFTAKVAPPSDAEAIRYARLDAVAG